MTSVTERTSYAPPTLAWVVKRALLGTALLALLMGGMAWLTYASLEPAVEQGGIVAPALVNGAKAGTGMAAF